MYKMSVRVTKKDDESTWHNDVESVHFDVKTQSYVLYIRKKSATVDDVPAYDEIVYPMKNVAYIKIKR